MTGSKYNNLGGGESIIYLELTNNQYHYCCGSYVTDNNGTVGCYTNQSSFVVGDGQLMYGYAGLENATLVDDSTTGASTASAATSTVSSASNTAVPASGHCDDESVKIGAGVGIPLGAVALMAVAWALWERRKAAKSKWAAVAGGGDQSAAVAGGRDQSDVVAGGEDQSAGVGAGGNHYPYYQYQQPYTRMQGQGDQGEVQFAQQARGPMAELQHTQPTWGPTAELHSQERPAEMMDRQSKGGVFSSATGF
ncbi:hypothetical protein SLS53_008172 [Cytospora paraplurivora]|uniref:Uncharacterized protein n=1 Tax=Cytospora paraplurivora TaxID=2898453 RepID=A0AAN9TYZ7_9PEZI